MLRFTREQEIYAIEKIEQMRINKGMKEKEFLPACGLAKNYIYQWKIGKFTPSEDGLRKILDFCGVDYNGFLDDIYKKHPAPPVLTLPEISKISQVFDEPLTTNDTMLKYIVEQYKKFSMEEKIALFDYVRGMIKK